MRVVHNKDGNRIYIDEVIGNNEQYYCPACGAELILKRGNIKTHHFAHKSLIDCDTFNHDMSEWHLNWQETFPKENREVVIKMDIPENVYRDNIYYLMGETLEEYNDFTLREERGELKTFHIKHRADVCVNNYVIEHAYSRYNGIENKPDIEVLINLATCFLQPLYIGVNEEMIWSSQRSEWMVN